MPTFANAMQMLIIFHAITVYILRSTFNITIYANVLLNKPDFIYSTTDTYNERNGQTISLSFRYNFGKLEDDKSQSRRKSFEKDGQGGSMDMGY